MIILLLQVHTLPLLNCEWSSFGPVKFRALSRPRNGFDILSLFKVLWAPLEWLKFFARLRTRDEGRCFYCFYEKGLHSRSFDSFFSVPNSSTVVVICLAELIFYVTKRKFKSISYFYSNINISVYLTKNWNSAKQMSTIVCANGNTSRFMLHRGNDDGQDDAEVHHAYYISFRMVLWIGQNPSPTMHLFAHSIVLERVFS